MAEQNISAVTALSLASLMMTELTGTNFEANNDMMQQQNSIMDSDSTWASIAKYSGYVLMGAGAIASLVTPFTSGLSGIKRSDFSTGFMAGLDFTKAVASGVKAASGGINAIASSLTQLDQQKIKSSQANGKGYITAGQQALESGQNLNKAVKQYIANLGQAENVKPVRG
ncbi:MAG: hypothetical protein ChlgKO_06780 [Chlamydiales bacterium]